MIYSIAYMLLAALALGFLIFIHELGHYFIARREGMIVEVFAIGFGKPIFSWYVGGVKWQICWLPFGGYVKISGMEKKGNLEPYEIPGGFFAKTPAARIRVALAGPLVNISMAFFLFCMIWLFGGREKLFSEYTHLVGWVDRASQVYNMGVRPGDEVSKINNRPFTGFNQLVYAAFLDRESPILSGYTIDYQNNQKQPFTFTLNEGQNLSGTSKARMTLGLMSPASFLIYHPFGGTNPVEGSAMRQAGLQDNDRIVWVDGELIFGQKHLVDVVNDPIALLTIQRGKDVFITKIPRVAVSDLRMSQIEKSELQDWLFASGRQSPLLDAFFIPYDLNVDGVVQSSISYIDDNLDETSHRSGVRSPLDKVLMEGDRIIAVDGQSTNGAIEVVKRLQTRQVQIIVERGTTFPPLSWNLADSSFLEGVDISHIQQLANSIGTGNRKVSIGNLSLLPPIQPKTMAEYPMPTAKQQQRAQQFLAQKQQIEALKDPQQKEAALRVLEEGQNKLILGIQLEDRAVIYNPSPMRLFFSAFDETWRTIKALFTGYLSPKYMSGPVGIVQAIHHGWTTGFNEALFWIAVISLNLGILNLLPLPVLDGGHIGISIWEAVTKKRIKAKTMERLIIPFIVLMLLFFLYATYNDILRLISRFF
ncbi:MAG: site-2 protease family protein [Chlamydiae bacterium]|nr:site-2 protease family protein [Chlamydiota bacterium]